MRSAPLYTRDGPREVGEGRLAWEGLRGLGLVGPRAEGQRLSCGQKPAARQLLRAAGTRLGRGGFGRRPHGGLRGGVELLERGRAFGLEPPTRVTFTRTGRRNRLP